MNEYDLVIQLIEKSLSGARAAIEAGEIWGSLVHIVHLGGVQTLIAKGIHSGRAERAKENVRINLLMEVLKSNLLVTVSDAWIGEETSDGNVAISFDSPLPGQSKALVVEIWGCGQRLASGMQQYRRFANGRVLFEEFLWADSLGPSGI